MLLEPIKISIEGIWNINAIIIIVLAWIVQQI